MPLVAKPEVLHPNNTKGDSQMFNNVPVGLKDEMLRELESIKTMKSELLKKLFENLSDDVISEIYACSKAYEKPMNSCVYFLKNEYSGAVKIGHAKNLIKRIEQLRSYFTTLGLQQKKLRLIGLVVTFEPFAVKIENEYHKSFEGKRLIGEWFKINEDEIKNEITCSADDFTFINDVIVDFSEQEWAFFKPVKKSFDIGNRDIGFDDSQFAFLNAVLHDINPLLQIVEISDKHNIGFAADKFLEKDGQFHRLGIKTPSEKVYTFKEIKKMKFDLEYWKEVIAQINGSR